MSLSSFDKKEPEGFVARLHVGKLSINYILCTLSINVQLCNLVLLFGVKRTDII